MASRQSSTQVTILPPREFQSTGFEVINPSQLVEEERLPFYNRNHYYPMRIGEVLKDRYQVLTKVGYGTSSTVWLCRDLRERPYWVLKVHVDTLERNRELEVYKHLAGVTIEHSGRLYVRRLEDSFKIKSYNGEHDCFVMTPLGMSLRTFQDMQPDRIFEQSLVKSALDQVLIGVDFLHDADVIHTDLHSDNLLIAITDDSILSTVEEDEIRTPSARKQVSDTFTYVSRYMLGARVGKEQSGNAMPVLYRAPEVILNMKWDNSVDIWSLGLLAWDLLERESLFHTYNGELEELNNAHHLAAMTALLGPPPPRFLEKSKETSKYWNIDGTWKGPVPLPNERKLHSLARTLTGDDEDDFLNFISSILCWLPEERLTPSQAYSHRWLRGRSDEPVDVLIST
ncbi:kinase-like protein [Leptodontidium sp. 2 PMI_412]|nr:kinase-like protein [Leptodontidium sp. 2 PMI_412]